MKTGDVIANVCVIQEKIGAGGIGEIYKAYHQRLNKHVVVKKVQDGKTNVINNRIEVDILKNLKHTYLPQVYDFIEEDGSIFTILEYIEGRNLRQIIEEGTKVSNKDVIRWGIQLCEALNVLHSQTPPIIHSDIKPGNVMITNQGDVVLIDFNVSLMFENEKSESLAVSHGFSPPEQYAVTSAAETVQAYDKAQESPYETTLSDDSATDPFATSMAKGSAPPVAKELRDKPAVGRYVDERSDIYSLGATLLYLISGKPPKKSIDRPKTPHDLFKDSDVAVLDGLKMVIEKAMSIDPRNRYSGAKKMLEALKNIKKLDRRYTALVVRQEILIVFFIIMLGASVFSVIYGRHLMQVNQVETTVALILESGSKRAMGEYEDAIQAANEALMMVPDDENAVYALAMALYDKGDAEGCLSFITEKLPLLEAGTGAEDDVMAGIYYLAATICFDEKNYFDANKYYHLAISKNDTNADFYRDLIISLARSGDIAQGEALIETALSKGFSNDTLYLAYGEVYLVNGEYSQAEVYFLKAIEEAKSDYLFMRAVISCARLYADENCNIPDSIMKQTDLLETHYSRFQGNNALIIDELLGDVYAKRVSLITDTDSDEYRELTKKALDYFYRIYDKGYLRFHIMYNIAILNQNIFEFEKAAGMLEEMTTVFPDDYTIYMRYSYLMIDKESQLPPEQRDYTKAVEYYDIAYEIYQRKPPSRNDLEMSMLASMINEIKANVRI